jgi:PncC family amidohydrolase
MSDVPVLPPLVELGPQVGNLLRERGETVAVAESSAGGLTSAALLAVPGASAFFLGGAVIYTMAARKALLGMSEADMAGMRPETEAYARFIASSVRERHGATWGLGESGAAGPTGSRYGDAPGHVALAVVGPVARTLVIETAQPDRPVNMDLFARQMLLLFHQALKS